RRKAEERKSAAEYKKKITDFFKVVSIKELLKADSTFENENLSIINKPNQVSEDESDQKFY
ncbi:8821_t:CDS:1, partial [Funneliformis caledonium]